ncbi:MAG: hypothetical protein J5927_04260 [Oscillospiraceae bacterium]|nr:hypothetical protein [Oscillospiraceae bacterium]
MLQSHISDHTWRLCLDEETLVRHSRQQPFAVMIRQEKRYVANRGSIDKRPSPT